MIADGTIHLNGDDYAVEAEPSKQITVSAASLERLKQGLESLLKQRRELDTLIARQEGGIQLMTILVEGTE